MQETPETRVQPLGQEDPWRRAWQPTPVFLPGESHRQRRLEGTVHGVAKSWTRLTWLSTHAMCIYVTPNFPISLPPLPLWVSIVCSLYWYLYFCFANKFMCTPSPDPTYEQCYMIFVFRFLTYFTVWQSLGPFMSANGTISFLFNDCNIPLYTCTASFFKFTADSYCSKCGP